MRQTTDDIRFFENNERINDDRESILDGNHEFDDIGGGFEKSADAKCNLNIPKGEQIINTRKWQIMVLSANCSIEKHYQGWQIYQQSENDKENNSKLILRVFDHPPMITNTETIETANAGILCNRNDLDDTNDEQEGHSTNNNGKIVFREYLKQLTTEEEKHDFILRVLTKAVNDQQIFAIYGNFPVLRKPLGKRGWIEKRYIRRMLSMAQDIPEASLDTIERLMRHPPNFIWYTSRGSSSRVDERTIVNRFSGSYFTSKVDMCNNLENVYWFYETGVSNIQFPRCYNVYQTVQVEEFVQDFYITACMGILQWFLVLANITGPNAVWSETGTVPIKAIFFALERCTEYISVCMHEDIDRQSNKDTTSSQWNQFLTWHDRLLQKRQVLRKEQQIDIEEIIKFTTTTVKEMMRCRPQSRMDGIRNVWIMKPGDKSLGRGITLKNSLGDILQKINQATKECMQYVVQKYIERPLLVHKTKVDVRQWFLITSTQPLVVWMYKDILLRFASKEFTLEDFHESIHLCNTTIQLKYRKMVKPGTQLPPELHWNLQDFKEYLRMIGRESAWEKVIKPGIKQNLVGALLASQENMVNRKNSFQLYGADFLIMDDLTVWLLEINTSPRLHPPSSTVTEKLYPEVIEDTMKVVLDRRKNKKAPRGKFECIFKQNTAFHGNVFGKAVGLGIRGKTLHTPQSTSRKV